MRYNFWVNVGLMGLAAYYLSIDPVGSFWWWWFLLYTAYIIVNPGKESWENDNK